MESGRIERRIPVSIAGRLKKSQEPLISESVSIQNVSNHGARVIAHQVWRPRDRVDFADVIGDFHVDAEVIYCEPLYEQCCAVGLRFKAPVIDPAAPSRSAFL